MRKKAEMEPLYNISFDTYAKNMIHG